MFRNLAMACFFSVITAVGLCGEENLIPNGDFEEGMKGWQGAVKLAEGEAIAHSGKFCATGKNDEKTRHCFLTTEVQLSSDKLYKLTFYLRSPESASAFVKLRGTAKKPQEVFELMKVPKVWRKYEAMFVPRESGKQLLVFGVPSALKPWSKRGRMFLDDVTLTEISAPATIVNLTNNEGYNDFPDMVLDGENRAWVAWISFAEGKENLKVGWLDGNNLHQVRLRLKHDGYIGRPFLVAARRGVYLLWAMEVNRNWDIYAARIVRNAGPEVLRITNNPATDIRPVGAVDGSGALWVAWESNRSGKRDIFAIKIENGKAEQPVRLTANDFNNCFPTICCDSRNRVYVAWESFRNHTYDIFMKSFADGKWSEEMQLTTDKFFDNEPFLVSRGEEVWMVWDNSACRRYAISNRTSKRVMVARIAPTGLLSPLNIESDSVLWRYAERGRVAFDTEGRLWIAVRRARNKRGDWDVWLQCYSGETWSEPIVISGAKDGVNRPASIAIRDGKVLIVWQSDDRPNRPQRIGYRGPEHSNIFAATMDCKALATAAETPKLSKLEIADESFDLAEYRKRFAEDNAERPEIDYGGETLKLFWGDFHEHTEISQCNARGDMSVDRNFAEMRDIARLDFGSLTDHGQDINAYDWHIIQKAVSQNHDPRRFVTFLAEEWAGSPINVLNPGKKGTYGHRNIIFANDRFPHWFDPVDGTPPNELWKMLKGENQITIPHQLADGPSSTDWRFVDEHDQPVAEIFQGRGSYEYNGAPRLARIIKKGHFIQDAWASGIIIGVIASPDHPGGWGKAAIFAPELSREALLDAARKRHTYGTTAAKILMDFRLNGKLMGEVVKAKKDESVRLTVSVKGTGKLKQVEVCKDNRFIHTVTPEGDTARFTFIDTQPRRDRSYYYIRAIQEDSEIAWSSPVWVESL